MCDFSFFFFSFVILLIVKFIFADNNMRTDILRRVIFTFLVTCVALSIENTASTERNKSIDKVRIKKLQFYCKIFKLFAI